MDRNRLMSSTRELVAPRISVATKLIVATFEISRFLLVAVTIVREGRNCADPSRTGVRRRSQSLLRNRGRRGILLA